MGEEVVLNQQEVKELLGKFYNDDKRYNVSLNVSDNTYTASNPALRLIGKNFQYGVEPGGISTHVELDIDASEFVSEFKICDKVYGTPIDKIKSLSVYDTLVKDYGFKDQEFIDGNHDTLRDYIDDHQEEEYKFILNASLQENFALDEDSLQRLEERGSTDIIVKSLNLFNTSENFTPNIISELGLGGQLVEEETLILKDYFDLEVEDFSTPFTTVVAQCDQ